MRHCPSLLIASLALSMLSGPAFADLSGIYSGSSNGGPTTFLQLFETDGHISGNITGAEFGTIAGQVGSDGVAMGTLDMGPLGAGPIEIRQVWSGVVLTLVGAQARADLAFFHQPSALPSVEAEHRYSVLSDVPYGRLSAPEIRQKLETGMLDPDTLVFAPGMGDWAPLSSLPEFSALIPGGMSVETSLANLAGIDDALRPILVATLIEQLPWFTPNQREAVVECALGVFSTLSEADHALLVRAQLTLPDAQQAAFDVRNPGLFERVFACADPAQVFGAPRSSIELYDGRIFAVSGPGNHTIDLVGTDPVFTLGGTEIAFKGGVLTVAGEPVDVPGFSKSLEVVIAADGSSSLIVDP